MTEKKTGAGWVEHGRRKCSFSKARGCGKRGRTGRGDVRVNCSAWGGSGKPLWHRFLAFYLQNPDHLTKKAFASKDVARASTDRKHNTNKTKRQTGTNTQSQTERQRTQTDRKKDRQTDRETGRQKNRQTATQTDRKHKTNKTNRQTETGTQAQRGRQRNREDKQTDRQADKQTHRQPDRQRQTARPLQTDRQADRQTNPGGPHKQRPLHCRLEEALHSGEAQQALKAGLPFESPSKPPIIKNIWECR